VCRATKYLLSMKFSDATTDALERVMQQAETAFHAYKKYDSTRRAAFLRAIASRMEAQRSAIIALAVKESHLSEARIETERKRTVWHLRMFADYIEEGSWVEARIDTALPDRVPAPRPDLRKMLVPLGPVVVFGAANFPLAYSTPGGDTVSALAVGCSVVVKGHPGHAETSQYIADIITHCADETGMPPHVFQHVHGASNEVGRFLVLHPATKAVGFTGSSAGGKALFDLANQRPVPVPVFAEMSSINPVFILPEALRRRGDAIARQLADSITQSVGQFCTNPGLLLGISGDDLNSFTRTLAEHLNHVDAAPMLNPGIASNFERKRSLSLDQEGVLLKTMDAEQGEGLPTLATVDAALFLDNDVLREEVFGPYSLLVRGESMEVLEAALAKIPGQLTATIIGEPEELRHHRDFIDRVREKVGRLIINGVPTGVEVCPAMHHGGPFPSTTDSRFTSVGTDAIKRFARPVCFQNCPDDLLPEELRDTNPRNIWRLRNGEWRK
jgi:alpha-ketoglutaric semialdehyde dehydrogenase